MDPPPASHDRAPDFGGRSPSTSRSSWTATGDGRSSRGCAASSGTSEGIGSVREITTECARMGVKSLTLYAFSVENWKRPRQEVAFLMELLEQFLVEERPTLMDNNVRLRAIGRIDDLPEAALARLRETEEITAKNDGLLLRLALSVRRACGDRRCAQAPRATSRPARCARATIDDETLRRYLYDATTPDPDLLIRTSGELRISNFLLWQISYSEIYVAKECWPEFRRPQLLAALEDYAKRVRKFGGLVSDTPSASEARA
jgi:undecaprenyl diphosphate synthase